MSFILDALKKSETERQRQSGPGFFQVKVAAPKASWPAWAYALGALLAINIGVVAWLMLRQPSRAAVVATPPAAQTELPAAQAPPPAAASARELPAEVAPLVESAAPTVEPETGTEDLNPEDYEPAAEPAAPASAGEAHAMRGTAEGLPTYEQVAGTPGNGLPELRLDLHVFAAKPQDRFILLNMHRLREGDSLPEGVRVDQITPGGAVLSFRNSKFVLERD
jgi:general secretion pathway protein B